MKRLQIVVLAFTIVLSLFTIQGFAQTYKQNELGPYKLGMSFKEVQKLEGFAIDTGRSDAAKGIVAGKIISKLFDQVTIQRFFFYKDKLYRATVIFGDPNYTEEQVKQLVAKQWGDPGPKQLIGSSNCYAWEKNKSIVMILPADGGRHMVSMASSEVNP